MEFLSVLFLCCINKAVNRGTKRERSDLSEESTNFKFLKLIPHEFASGEEREAHVTFSKKHLFPNVPINQPQSYALSFSHFQQVHALNRRSTRISIPREMLLART